MSEIHRRRTPTSPTEKIEFSFVGNDRRPSQKSGTRRENRNAPDSPDLSPLIPDNRGYLRFRVFISRQNLGRSGNSKIPDCLRFYRHMKTRLKGWFPYDRRRSRIADRRSQNVLQSYGNTLLRSSAIADDSTMFYLLRSFAIVCDPLRSAII